MWIELGGFVILMLLSGFFSSSETALFSLNDSQIEQMRREKVERLGLIEQLLSQPRRLIVTILIGNELVNVAASVLSASVIIRVVGAENKWLNLLIMVPILLVFGEITPKTLAIRQNRAFATVQAPFIELFAKLITPLRLLIRWVADLFITMIVGKERSSANIITEDMVRSLADEAVGEGTLDKQEAHYINRIFDFGDVKLHDIMTPRSQVFFITVDMPLDEIVLELKRTRHTKVPVYDTDGETVLGILFARDLLGIDIAAQSKSKAKANAKRTLSKLLRHAYFVPETKLAADLFHTFRMRKLSLAVTVDEFGGVTGMVTMEDLLETIFGEILSSSEQLKQDAASWEIVSENQYRVTSTMPLAQFCELTGVNFSREDVETLGGLLLETCGELPSEGTSIQIDRCSFIVESVKAHRIGELMVKVTPPQHSDEDQLLNTDTENGTVAEVASSVAKEEGS